MNESFRLLLFGLPHVTRTSMVISGFESRKALAMLAYLVVHVIPVPRSQLAHLFWPDQPETRGRGNVRRVTHNLTTLLPGCFLLQQQTVSSNPWWTTW